MKNIIDYKIITLECEPRLFDKKNEPSDMEKIIKEHIKQGWQPYGELKFSMATGGSFLGTTSHPVFTQAMVKYDK